MEMSGGDLLGRRNEAEGLESFTLASRAALQTSLLHRTCLIYLSTHHLRWTEILHSTTITVIESRQQRNLLDYFQSKNRSEICLGKVKWRRKEHGHNERRNDLCIKRINRHCLGNIM